MGLFEFIRRGIGKMFSKSDITDALKVSPAISDIMRYQVQEWLDMYSGHAPWIDNKNIKSLRLESAIVREFATVATVEMDTSLQNEQLNEYYQAAISKLGQKLQRGMATGAMCIKPLPDMTVEYISQGSFIPLRYDASDNLVSVAFPEIIYDGDTKYTRMEFHDLVGETLHIRNIAFMAHGKKVGSDDGELGVRVPLTVRDEWKKLAEDVYYDGVKHPLYGYYVNPIDNTYDNTAAGVSIFGRSSGLIQEADTQFGRLSWEFESAERAVHVDASAIQRKGASWEVSHLKDRLYRGFNMRGVGSKEGLFEDFSPDVRDANFINGLNEIKREIEFSCGLAYGDLSDPQTVDKTATEIRASKKRKFDTVSNIQDNLKDCLQGLSYALAFYNGSHNADVGFACTFKDSILVDEQEERKQDMLDMSAGIMTKAEYRAKWYGETVEDAEKNLPQSADVLA